MVGRT